MKEHLIQNSPFDNIYHFITEWNIEATCEEVSDLLDDATGLARWWSSVYLDIKILLEGGEKGIGKTIALYTKGWLPYTIRWNFEVTESKKPYGFSIRAFGDLQGTGIWTFTQEGKNCKVVYDWNIIGNKPLFKYFSFIMKPVFARNHYWAMKKGEESIILELRRMNGELNVPPPPPPTFPHNRTDNKIL